MVDSSTNVDTYISIDIDLVVVGLGVNIILQSSCWLGRARQMSQDSDLFELAVLTIVVTCLETDAPATPSLVKLRKSLYKPSIRVLTTCANRNEEE